MIKHIILEPLLHFSVIAALVFLFFGGGQNTDEQLITIRPDDLRKFAQATNQMWALRDPNNEPAQLRLIEQYAEQEALFREARALGLDTNDATIRRHMIQRMRLLLEGLSADSWEGESTADELGAFYQRNISAYKVPEKLSFKHIFFAANSSANQNALTKAEAAAHELANDLNARIQGDAFPYQRAYLDNSADEIARHFGTGFANELFALQPSQQWQGPLTSEYGLHLVKVSSKHAAKTPPLNEITRRVKNDYQRFKSKEQQRSALAQLLKKYQIRYLP